MNRASHKRRRHTHVAEQAGCRATKVLEDDADRRTAQGGEHREHREHREVDLGVECVVKLAYICIRPV